jgi:transposase
MSTHYTSYEKLLFVAMDIGKNVHWLAAYHGAELTPLRPADKLRSTHDGLNQVTQQMDGWLADPRYEQVILGHEPTGIYHENWARALLNRYGQHLVTAANLATAVSGQPRLDYRFLNPLLVKRQRETLTSGRRRKTDALDLDAIAHCLRDGLGYPAALPSDDELRLALWSRAYRQLQRQQRRLEMDLTAQVDRLWPGLIANVKRFQKMHPDLEPPLPLVRSRPFTRRSVQAILCHCPNPYDFIALDVAGIQAFLRQHTGRCGPVTAAKAQRIVSQAVLPPPDVAALLSEQVQTTMRVYLAGLAQAANLEAQVAQFVPQTAAAVLTTIPGVSPFLGARYLGYLKHSQRFSKPSEVWSFAGFDLVTEESGDSRRLGKITRKGHPGLRDTLYLIGYHTAQNVPAIGRAYQRALANGKGKVGATLHAAQKANRLCHRLLYDQIPFDPDRSR